MTVVKYYTEYWKLANKVNMGAMIGDDMLISLTLIVISLYMCISNHHVVSLKQIEFLLRRIKFFLKNVNSTGSYNQYKCVCTQYQSTSKYIKQKLTYPEGQKDSNIILEDL